MLTCCALKCLANAFVRNQKATFCSAEGTELPSIACILSHEKLGSGNS